MIVFAAIVPHSPLLVPTVGKEAHEKLERTSKAYHELEEVLYLSKPDSLIVISPHAPMYPDAFSGNVANRFAGSLKEFGDLETTIEAKADFLLLDHIHRGMRTASVPFTLTSQEILDYGTTIPLLLLTTHLTNWKLVPLATSSLDGQAHYTFGQQLKQVLHAEEKRIAVIASADLSHHANATSPHGARPEGEQFDRWIREKTLAQDVPGLTKADTQLLERAGQCGYRPIVTLLGALEHVNCTCKELAYESPFGVSYWTVRIDIA